MKSRQGLVASFPYRINTGHANPQLIGNSPFGDLGIFLQEFLDQGGFIFIGGLAAFVAAR